MARGGRCVEMNVACGLGLMVSIGGCVCTSTTSKQKGKESIFIFE